ncbi:MAG: peptidoglycan DD-metalloendopeptidase family protein [Alphaproteobacteria bacterium]|nr:peptidoglycan DD-metalloendopeptidase family protein [Alphaproteobacteria bacterium]
MGRNTKLKIKKPRKLRYISSKPFFSNKEIIFRSGGRAKVFNISSRLQIFALIFVVLIGVWSTYSYHIYHKSDKLMSKLDHTRDAYADLMSDFVAVHKNINSLFAMLADENVDNESDLNRYKQQVQVMEDKIKQITDNEDWLKNEGLDQNMTVREAILERDRVLSERAILLSKIQQLESSVQKLEISEMEILNKVAKISEVETQKIKDALSNINKSIKNQNKYYNPLAGGKKDSSGGAFEPAPEVDNEKLSQKMRDVFSQIDDLSYYRDVMRSVPTGKPVWNYHVSSPFGYRADPFNKQSATHKGVDLASNQGNIIKVMADGKVTRNEWVNGYGNLIEIDHENGFKTKYAHLNKSYVTKGQTVTKGDQIAEVGSTGRSTGPHLHYEVIYNGVNVDQMAFITAFNKQ